MRSLVDKGPARDVPTQTDLTRADIDDIYGHFDQMQAQVRARHADQEALSEARREIERLEEELRSVRASAEKSDPRGQSQPWLLDRDGAYSSNENLLTNRGSQADPRDAAGGAGSASEEILVSERGGLT